MRAHITTSHQLYQETSRRSVVSYDVTLPAMYTPGLFNSPETSWGVEACAMAGVSWGGDKEPNRCEDGGCGFGAAGSAGEAAALAGVRHVLEQLAHHAVLQHKVHQLHVPLCSQGTRALAQARLRPCCQLLRLWQESCTFNEYPGRHPHIAGHM